MAVLKEWIEECDKENASVKFYVRALVRALEVSMEDVKNQNTRDKVWLILNGYSADASDSKHLAKGEFE